MNQINNQKMNERFLLQKTNNTITIEFKMFISRQSEAQSFRKSVCTKCHKLRRFQILRLSLVFSCSLFYLFFIYFISIFILLTRRKAMEALIHRASNYPDLLPNMPRYCCPLVPQSVFPKTQQNGASGF